MYTYDLGKNQDETWQEKGNILLRVEAPVMIFTEQINAFLMQTKCLVTKTEVLQLTLHRQI